MEENKEIAKIIHASDVYEKMKNNLKYGLQKGTTTYIDEIDEAWTWRWSEVNIHTGMSNEGKSSWMRFLTLIKCLEENCKAILFAPEDAPPEYFYDDLIHTLSGKSTDKTNPNFIGEELYDKCFNIIKEFIVFLYIKPPFNTVEKVLEMWEKALEEERSNFDDLEEYEKNRTKILVIDPYIRLVRSKLAPDRDDLYAAYLMSLLTDFAQRWNVSIHMIMHQQTAKRNDSGYYAEPNMYAVKGGGTFVDMVDNVISVWRPFYAKDKLNTEVHITSQKIKKQKLTGVPQTVKFRFNRKTNRYVDYNNDQIDIYNFDKWFREEPIKPKIAFKLN